MKYSFVLPAYKATYFKEAIDSILNQTYNEFELIIVNDASPEDIGSIVKSYDDQRIQYYVNEENIGGKDLVAQWNLCVGYATGDYIILASDDDLYAPDYLEKMDKLVQKYPLAKVFRPRVQLIDELNHVIKVEAYLNEETTLLEYIYMLHNNYIFGGVPYYIYNREAIINIDGFVDMPLAWGSDDMTTMILAYNNGIKTSKDVLFSFRMSGDNITSKKNNVKMLKKKLRARKIYYSKIVNIIEQLVPNNDMDLIYKKYMREKLQILLRKDIYGLFCGSTMWACLGCIHELRTMISINWRWLIASYAKKIGQSIVGY